MRRTHGARAPRRCSTRNLVPLALLHTDKTPPSPAPSAPGARRRETSRELAAPRRHARVVGILQALVERQTAAAQAARHLAARASATRTSTSRRLPTRSPRWRGWRHRDPAARRPTDQRGRDAILRASSLHRHAGTGRRARRALRGEGHPRRPPDHSTGREGDDAQPERRARRHGARCWSSAGRR